MKMMAQAWVTFEQGSRPARPESGLAADPAERAGQVGRFARLEKDGQDQDAAVNDVDDDE
jgi:hypothetical protein